MSSDARAGVGDGARAGFLCWTTERVGEIAKGRWRFHHRPLFPWIVRVVSTERELGSSLVLDTPSTGGASG